jgi:hypothetical protein
METGEHREYKAHNIILNSMWDRLTAILTPTSSTSTTGRATRIQQPRADNAEQLSRHEGGSPRLQISRLPDSQWRQMIVLQPAEHVGKTIKEVGIAYGSTQATFSPMRRYRTARATRSSSARNWIPKFTPSTQIFLSAFGATTAHTFMPTGCEITARLGDDGGGPDRGGFSSRRYLTLTKSSTRTRNATEKWVQGKVRFEAADYNRDVRFLRWVNMGMQIELPRPGVWGGKDRRYPRRGGWEQQTTFAMPNSGISDLVVYVDDVEQTKAPTTLLTASVEFGTAPASALPVTADYFCPYIPKDSDHVLDVTFRLNFDMDEPSPVVTPPDYSGLNLPDGRLNRMTSRGTAPSAFSARWQART